ncbi:gliding motility protein GldN [Barnesiella sp. An55]|uniref:type IX secretion system ring protein PorN/GldN n=1 Tax=Barnesiella sp. An55 TaxID=1965646 RepID=UPI001F14E242|nr:gliding motility protein GldN [Barnesiella sp. An55]
MNILIKSCLTLGLLLSTVGGHAQVVKKSDTDDSKKTNSQLSVRAQSLYDTQDASDADIPWMRVIYRQIDLTKEKNLPLYYPEESTENQENLFRIIMKLLANNQIAAYEYLDGREIFTDEYRIKVREMFDRFHILYSEAKGYSEKNPRFTIEESDIPSNEVLSYYILERWKFDRRTSQLKPSIEAICPVLHRTGDFGGEAVRYPMFWVKYNDIRPYIARQYILASNENNIAQYNYDDYFQMRMYDGEIYKTQNLRNQSLMQMYPNDSIRKQAQDSIELQLKNFNDNLWVPTPEELAKAREEQEAKEAKANGEEVSADSKQEKAKSSSRSSRAKRQKEAKAKKQKQPKQQKASSAPVRSVRRTR